MSLSIPKKPGVYLLLISVVENTEVATRSKLFNIPKGCYVYIGSARGRGGLYSRVKRYLCSMSKKFWHIDYLLSSSNVKLCGLMYRVVDRMDSDWEAKLALMMRELFPFIRGFGCSDKRRDISHLYRCGDSLNDCLEKLVFLERESFRYMSLNQLVYKPL